MNRIQYQAARRRIGALDCVVIGPTEPDVPVAGLGVFCHGFGAGGDDLVGLAGGLLQRVDANAPLRLVFPTAPLELSDQGLPGGRAWWLLSIQRLLSAMEERRYDVIRAEVPDGIDSARAQLTETVELALGECQLDSSRLLLGGFSQGAMLSVDVALRGLAEPPGKLCLYSGALICEPEWRPRLDRLAACEILQSHGRLDPILPLLAGRWLHDMLVEGGSSVEFIEFDGPHTIPFEAIERTAAMLAELA